jgi:hypothetical protein
MYPHAHKMGGSWGVKKTSTHSYTADSLVLNPLSFTATEIVTDKELDKIFDNVESKIKLLDVDELSVPRTRKPPARFCGLAEAY